MARPGVMMRFWSPVALPAGATVRIVTAPTGTSATIATGFAKSASASNSAASPKPLQELVFCSTR